MVATSDFDPAGAAVSVDTSLLLNLAPSSFIDTSTYRYACYRLQLDSSAIDRSGNNLALHDAGFVSRIIFADTTSGALGSTKAVQVFERSSNFLTGLSTYCIDLWDDSIFEPGATWRGIAGVNILRLDPLESRMATSFAVDFVALHAENFSRDKYILTWEISDQDLDRLNIDLYYDTDSSDFNGTLIGRVSQGEPGAGSFAWILQNLSAVDTSCMLLFQTV